MDLIPRKDTAVQDRLQPFVDQPKKKRQTKNKDKKESGKPDETKTISALKSSGQLLDTEAIVGKVVHKSDLRTYARKDNTTGSFFNLLVADKTGSIKVMVYGTERFKDIIEKSCYMFKKVIVDGNLIKVTSLTTVSKTTAIKIPAKVQREAQMIIDQEPASSKAQTSAQKMPVTVQGTVTGIGPGKPVKSKLEKTGTQSKGTKVTPKTTKMSTKFEQKWKTSLTSILEKLSNSEYKKMLLNLDKIPKKLKTGREEMPQIITQYYGAEQSVLAIKKVMDLILSKDTAVQDLLRPFVDQLKKKDETMKVEEPCGQSSKPGGTAGPSAGATGGKTMAGDKHFVDEHRVDLIQRVTNIEPILDELLGDFIKTEAYDNIRAKSTSQEKMRELYNALKAGEEVKDAFYKLLEKYEGCLVRDIKKKTKHT